MQSVQEDTQRGVLWGLQRRLLLLLLLPLGMLGLLSGVLHYQSAGNIAQQQDQRLQKLIPLLADSVVVTARAGERLAGRENGDPIEAQRPGLVLLLAPPVEEFLKEQEGYAAYAILDANGVPLLGDTWLPTVLPSTAEPEFLSVVEGGITYRVVAQRSASAAGDLILMLADGSDARQQWLNSVLLRVLFPNLLLLLVAGIGVTWAVSRAMRPLLDLKLAVERRSPRDLSPIDGENAPAEVRPLVLALNRLFALVNAQSEAQRRFVADAAHQLRTPLAGLQTQVEAWAQASRSATSGDSVSLPVEQVRRLRDATRRTSQLANQLLALSRADAASADTQPLQQVDLRELCENILAIYLDQAAEKQIDLGLEASAAIARGHAWLLRELLLNLVDNAIKYTTCGGSVTLRCGQREEANGSRQTWLEVEDDGPGIPAQEIDRALQRFYRVPGTAGEGNGLGLAIADEIARTHHAQLSLGPGSQGRGLRIRLSLDGAS